MTSPRTVVIAGAGIGGLTAAIALAQRGFRVSVIEQAERLEAIGAGIQLSPNASRVLIGLGLGERLAPYVVAPQALNVMNARTGRVLARAPLGDAAAKRYGAPYWVIHRGDLHTVLRETIEATPLISLQLGMRAEDFAVHDNGVTVGGRKDEQPIETHGAALIGADGLWSALRGRLGHRTQPRFAHHTAWRALVPPDAVSPALRAPSRQPVARPARASRALPGARRQPHQRGRDPARPLARDRLERAPATATRSWRAFPPACGTRRRAS